FTHHRRAAEPAHQPAQRRIEQRVLAEEAHAQAEREYGRDAEDEVPVRGVRGDDRDELRAVRELALDAPARRPEERAAEQAREVVPPARQARRQVRNAVQALPLNSSWRQASNTTTATALE